MVNSAAAAAAAVSFLICHTRSEKSF